MQEICNLLINHACRYIDPSTIFSLEVKWLLLPFFCSKVEEAMDKIKKAQKTLKEFKSCFQVHALCFLTWLSLFWKAYKKKCPSYFKKDEEAKNWNFNEDLIFHRFNAFLERLKIVLDCCNTTNQFLMLEKVWHFPLKTNISGKYNLHQWTLVYWNFVSISF